MAANADLPGLGSTNARKPLSDLQITLQIILWAVFAWIVAYSMKCLVGFIQLGHDHSGNAPLGVAGLMCVVVPIVLVTGTVLYFLSRWRFLKCLVLLILATVGVLSAIVISFYDLS